MEVGADGVAVIAFTNPPVNLLSLYLILDSFKEKYEQALRRDDVKAIVITGSNGKFSGGFDVNAFGGGRKREEPKPGYVSIDLLTDTFEAAKKPSVAAIDGVAFGGALETAMICHARISTSTAQLGSPELQFGLIPGLGGEATRKGFYLYDSRRRASPDPEMTKYIEKSRSIAGVTADSQLMKLPGKDIVEMIFFPVVNESCCILEEGIVLKASDLDIASVMGAGFPRYSGGIMFWADNLESTYICSKMETWAKKYGDFYKLCAYLAERAAYGASLRGPVEHANSRL